MLLKDKKTGGNVNVKITFETEYTDEIEAKTYKGKPLTLKLLAECFEDVPEEIKSWEEVMQIKELPSGLKIADQDYYEILPGGTKKTKFTWDEAMEIERKTNGKWRVPSSKELKRRNAYVILKEDTKGFVPNWTDKDQPKYYAVYNYYDNRVDVNIAWSYKAHGWGLYFATKEDIRASIKNHKQLWLDYLGVEEEE